MRMSRRAGVPKNAITQSIAQNGDAFIVRGIHYVQGVGGQIVRITPKFSKGVMK